MQDIVWNRLFGSAIVILLTTFGVVVAEQPENAPLQRDYQHAIQAFGVSSTEAGNAAAATIQYLEQAKVHATLNDLDGAYPELAISDNPYGID